MIESDFQFFPFYFVPRHIANFRPAQKLPGFGKKKLSREPKTFVSPKWNRLVPTYRGPIDSILEGCSKIFFEIIFFPKKVVENDQNLLF